MTAQITPLKSAESSKEQKASDLFARALENEGVKHVFAVPGEENLDLLDSLRTSTIELVLTRHEQAAAFMAATYGRLTGRAGVCLATLGPGATNLVTGAAYAKLGAMPMVMITGQKPIKKSKQGRFQIIDVVRMMSPITKQARQIVHGNTIPALVREAFRIAEEERPGPVHLELPEDIAAEMTDAAPFPAKPAATSEATAESIAQAAEHIQKAKHPLLLIGAGANRKQVCQKLAEFVDATGIPFFTTQMGKGVVDERHPLYLGTAALSENDYLHCAIDRADLIVNVGHDVVEKPPFFMRPGGKQVIHVNYSSAEVDEVYFPQWEVVGDIADSIARLGGALTQSKAKHDFSYFMRVRDEVHAHILEGSEDDRFPIYPQRLVADVREVMPSDGIIALDNGVYKIWFARNYAAHQPNTVLLDNALASMGAGLPSAMMAAALYPERKVVAICGDGGFMMNSQEIETAVRLKLNVTVLILRDDAYGMIRWKQEAMGFPDYGLTYGNPDFVAYAESYGAHGHRPDSAESFAPLLQQCLEEGGVHVVDVPVDYSDNVRALVDELQEKVCLL